VLDFLVNCALTSACRPVAVLLLIAASVVMVSSCWPMASRANKPRNMIGAYLTNDV